MDSGARSISLILHAIVSDTQDIVRSEIRLAKAELREEAIEARAVMLRLVVGALAGFFGLLFVLLAAVYALSLIMAPWMASLVVAAVISAIAGIALVAGLTRFKSVHLVPRTVASLKENFACAKRQTK